VSVETITTRRFKCDNLTCDKKDEFKTDSWAGKAGWALGEINGQRFVLCPEHYTEFRIKVARI
jgi:hypothetical protein